jgi:hypothetical protein
MPRRSRTRARTAISDEQKTEFGEGKIESEIRATKSEAIGSANSSTVRLGKTQKSERVKELTPIEKSNGERKQKPKEPKIRAGLLSDINRALLKNKEIKDNKENVPPAKQTGGRISILV